MPSMRSIHVLLVLSLGAGALTTSRRALLHGSVVSTGVVLQDITLEAFTEDTIATFRAVVEGVLEESVGTVSVGPYAFEANTYVKVTFEVLDADASKVQADLLSAAQYGALNNDLSSSGNTQLAAATVHVDASTQVIETETFEHVGGDDAPAVISSAIVLDSVSAAALEADAAAISALATALASVLGASYLQVSNIVPSEYHDVVGGGSNDLTAEEYHAARGTLVRFDLATHIWPPGETPLVSVGDVRAALIVAVDEGTLNAAIKTWAASTVLASAVLSRSGSLATIKAETAEGSHLTQYEQEGGGGSKGGGGASKVRMIIIIVCSVFLFVVLFVALAAVYHRRYRGRSKSQKASSVPPDAVISAEGHPHEKQSV